MVKVEVESIIYSADTKEELKDFIFRCYKRDFPASWSNTDYMWYKNTYFDNEWSKEDASEEWNNIHDKYWGCAKWRTDIQAILQYYMKYGKNKEPRSLFNMED